MFPVSSTKVFILFYFILFYFILLYCIVLYCIVLYCIVFLGQHPEVRAVSRLGVESELELLAYTTATATATLDL